MGFIRSVAIWERLAVMQPKRTNTRATALICIEVSENLLRFLGVFGQDKLQMMPERHLNSGNVLVGNANAVGQRSKNRLALLQGGQSTGAEAFVLGIELFEQREA